MKTVIFCFPERHIFEAYSGKELGTGLECVKDNFLPLKSNIFLGERCKPFKPLAPGLVSLPCTPQLPIKKGRAGKGQRGLKLWGSRAQTLHRESLSKEGRRPPHSPPHSHPGGSGFLASPTFSGNSYLLSKTNSSQNTSQVTREGTSFPVNSPA